jgi:Domain of unknown function (DUF4082)/Secretion system C-terminal sorting domain
MAQTQSSRSIEMMRSSLLLLISFFVFSKSFSQITTIFTTQLPIATTDNDHQPTVGQEVGMKFTSSIAGNITGIRFYKTAGNTGSHIGELYSSTGILMAGANFFNETATGWQTVTFPSPVAITANTTYTAAYFSSLGNYTEDNDYFKGHSITNSPLTAPADGTNGGNGSDPGNGQGTYVYTSLPAFPNQLFRSANYWVDVIFSPGSVTANVQPFIESISLPTSSVILDGSTSTGQITGYSWTLTSFPSGAPVPTITSPSSVSTTVTGLTQGTFTFQLSLNSGVSKAMTTIIVDAAPPPVANAGPDETITLPTSQVQLQGQESTGFITSYTWTEVSGPNTATIISMGFSPSSPFASGLIQGTYLFQLSLNGGVSTDQCIVTVLPESVNIFTTQIPAVGTDNDHQPTVGQEVGVKFTSNTGGNITGIRFYKTSGNTGTHIGELYSSAGARLAQATFTNETATGWQSVSFSSPVSITANTIYTAAYFSSLGNYTEENNYFLGKSVTNNPLIAAADGTNGGNGTDPGTGQGTFKYSSSPVFPNQLYKSANYWVDVIFSSAPSSLIANAGPDQTFPTLVSTVNLSANNSVGPITSYLWTLVSGPNVPVITTPNASNTTVIGLTIGTYIFKLSLNGGLSTSQVSVKLFYAAPTVSVNPTPTVILPITTTSLIGGSQGLMDGTTTSLLWTEISGPNSAVIVSPNGQLIRDGVFKTDVNGLIQGVYVFQVLAKGPGGMDSARTTVIVIPATQSFVSIFTTQTPAVGTDNDHQATVGQEVGVKFTSASAGTITGIRFYKTSGNSGTHIGELYSAAGVRLAQVTFTNEDVSGWQVVNFPSAVAITANTTYTAAYFSSLGNYTEENDYFLHRFVTNSPLTAPADGTNGGNGTDPGTGQGTYKYTSSPDFPNQLFRSANYWVDVVFVATASTMAAPALTETARDFNQTKDSTGVLNYFLGQNYPNPVPMSQSTKIEYSVPIASNVELVLYDMQGRPVKIMINEMKNAGRYSYDLNTGVLAKGLYIYSMHAGNFHDVKKLVLQ